MIKMVDLKNLRTGIHDVIKEIQLECNTDKEIIKMVNDSDNGYNFNEDEKEYILRMLV